MPGTSFCEWKGDVCICGCKGLALRQTLGRFAAIVGIHLCFVGGLLRRWRKVQAQQGDFYGGWITPDVGPFKGDPGTRMVAVMTAQDGIAHEITPLVQSKSGSKK